MYVLPEKRVLLFIYSLNVNPNVMSNVKNVMDVSCSISKILCVISVNVLFT